MRKPLPLRQGGIAYLLLFAVFLLTTSKALAQTISISPKTGNVVQVASYGNESALEGYGGAWIHNQLPMYIFVSDEASLSPDGLMAVHANNIKSDGTNFTLVSGATTSVINHISVSLPKGYRFTSYKIAFEYTNDGNSNVSNSTLSERDSTFETALVTAKTVSSSNKTSTLERTATYANPMGNVLYFYQTHENSNGNISSNNSYIKVTSFQISFECDAAFTEQLHATMIGQTDGVDCLQIPFASKRTDIGGISRQNNAQRYTFTNVTDLMAQFSLYDNDGISNGTADPNTKKDGHINTAFVGDNIAYALQTDTYWLEVPTDATTQGGTNVPLGYRITGAKLHYSNASTKTNTSTLLSIKSGDKYMNSARNFTAVPFTWAMDNSGYVKNGDVYLKVLRTNASSSYGSSSYEYNLTTTGDKSDATKFTLSSNKLSYKVGNTNYYVCASNNFGTLEKATGIFGTTAPSSAATVSTISVTVPSGTSTYTLKLYDKEGTDVAQETTVDASNPSGTLEVTGLNNDAIKFEVADLSGNAAYVYAELTLEALNPYIAKTDIVATQVDGTKTLAQSFLSDDFTIGEEGDASFYVPDNFASGGVKFTFDNLTNKKADATYGPVLGDGGNSRYHYVKSDYYNSLNEDLQSHRAEVAADGDYTKKVAVSVVGSQAFQCNNGSLLGTSSGTTYFEEYRYTNAAYEEQGGKWEEVQMTTDKTTKECFLVTCDETRYNIAPTTTPRHVYYAHYSTKVTMQVANYEPALTYTKVYDNAMLAGGFDNNAYYGVTTRAKMTDDGTLMDEGTGYLFPKQILDKIKEDTGKADCPVDVAHVLYIDASKLKTIVRGSDDANFGTFETLQATIGKNAMFYLPIGTTYHLNNMASKTTTGDFKAETNIVLTDKLPFFAPYDIRVDANNYTQYTREVTPHNGKVEYLSMALPFTIDISSNGIHSNKLGGSSFQLYTMQATNATSLSTSTGNKTDLLGHFTPVTGTLTESNKPYVVHILEQEAGLENGKVLFIVRQNGASIVATPTKSGSTIGDQLTGETTTGTVEDQTMTFQNYGTFNGAHLVGTAEKHYFYFNRDAFVSSDYFDLGDRDVYVLPFRTYYDYTGATNSKYTTMLVSLAPNDEPTSIGHLATRDNGLNLNAGYGTLTITANASAPVTIHSLNGQTVSSFVLGAGDSQTVSLTAGIYLVNGQKVLVR